MTFDLHKTVANLRKELQELCNQRKHIELRLVNLNGALSSLAGEIEDPQERDQILKEIQAARRTPGGLSESIIKSLRETHDSLSANEVRDWLEREGVDLSDYSQPLGTISVTLRRLAASGCVKATRVGRGVTYKWIGER
jgi:chromosome segregation ATPase